MKEIYIYIEMREIRGLARDTEVRNSNLTLSEQEGHVQANSLMLKVSLSHIYIDISFGQVSVSIDALTYPVLDSQTDITSQIAYDTKHAE